MHVDFEEECQDWSAKMAKLERRQGHILFNILMKVNIILDVDIG